MHRSITVIVAAILLTQPNMSRTTAEGYAKVVQEEASKRHFDPYTVVSMVHFESRWQAGVESGGCVGLGQVCLSNYPFCRQDPTGDRCQAKRASLLDGVANLRAVGAAITANRRFCRKKTGRAKFHHWLASYGGFNKPGEGHWCGQRKVRGRWRDLPIPHIVNRVMKRRRKLMR